MSTRLTLTPLRYHNPRKNRGIPTISAGRLDGGTANVSTVDTELPTGSTPRRPAWSQWWDRAPSPGAGLTFRRLTPARPFLVPARPPGGGSTTVPALPPRAGTLPEGGDLLTEGCAYCTSPRLLWSRPNPPSVAPDPRAVSICSSRPDPRQRQPHFGASPRMCGADGQDAAVAVPVHPRPPHARG